MSTVAATNGAAIYVESIIDAPIDDVWAHTQEPAVHQRWDVRFSHIDYLPSGVDEPQQFVYATTVAPGLSVTGCGETLGERHRADGTAYSGLKFWSDHPFSLIAEGSGYWRYIPLPDGRMRFLTRYDYRVRWGAFGRAVDRRIFRPLFGWGTAWSFDRLRLWIEKGISPERALKQTITHAIAVLTVAAIWIYQGLMPKLLFPGSGELQMFEATGISLVDPRLAIAVLGLGQVLFGLIMLVRWRSRWPFVLTAMAMPLLLLGATAGDSLALERPFNPVTLNVAMVALATIALLTRDDLPSGRTPLRSPERTNQHSISQHSINQHSTHQHPDTEEVPA